MEPGFFVPKTTFVPWSKGGNVTATQLKDNFTCNEIPRIYDLYNSAFEVIPADTPALLRAAYRLRYKVYCTENSYERPGKTDLEIDEFDQRSAHSLLYDRRNEIFIGTVRIILPSADPEEQPFPFQRLTSNRLLSGRGRANLRTAAEISRFAISKEYRRRTHEALKNSIRQHPSLMRYITLGLLRAIIQMSMKHGITDWYAIMEPSLLRTLSGFGIYFMPIGPLVEHHGMRQPCHSGLHTLLEKVRKHREDVWEVITDEGRLLEMYPKEKAEFAYSSGGDRLQLSICKPSTSA